MGSLRLLLDTHAFYWWLTGNPALSLAARAAITDRENEKYVSAITAWEFIIKFRSGKEPGFVYIAADVAGAVASQGMTELPLTMRHSETLPACRRTTKTRWTGFSSDRPSWGT